MKNDLSFLYKINNTIRERILLQPTQKILIAVSGGQDSIGLLLVLFSLKKKWNWKIGIIHCDHRWSGNSQFQAEHVARLALQLQIDYYESITLNSVKTEGIARSWRYDLIQTIAISNNYTAIVTGHNASDRTETLLYNLTRGSGLNGLQSIKWKRNLCYFFWNNSIFSSKNCAGFVRILKYRKSFLGFYQSNKKKLHLIRPLLEITRTEIRTEGHLRNLPLWLDRTNQELRIRRNRIRHRIVPYFRLHYNLNADKTLARWTEIVQAETFYLEQVTSSLLSKIEMKKFSFLKKKNSFQSAISVTLLQSLPLAIQRRSLKEYIFKVTGRNLGFHSIEQIRLFCLSQNSFSKNILIFRLAKPYSFIFDCENKKKMNVKKKNDPWIILPSGVRFLVKKNVLFFFFTKKSDLRNDKQNFIWKKGEN